MSNRNSRQQSWREQLVHDKASALSEIFDDHKVVNEVCFEQGRYYVAAFFSTGGAGYVRVECLPEEDRGFWVFVTEYPEGLDAARRRRLGPDKFISSLDEMKVYRWVINAVNDLASVPA